MSYSSEVLADSPVLYLRCAEASGNPQDSSGNGNHVTSIVGTPTYSETGPITTDAPDKAIGLKDNASALVVPHNGTLDVDDIFTLEAWVKRDSIGNINRIFDKQSSNFALVWETNNTLTLYKCDSSTIVQSTLAVTDTTTWHHCVCTKDGATTKLYIDGSDVTGTVTNATIVSNAENLRIGCYYNQSIQFLDGTIDEVAIYPTALGSSRVQAHYEAATATLTAPVLRTVSSPLRW
jgi:hypothetical protein